MPHARRADPVGGITALERAHDSAAAPLFGAANYLACQYLDVLEFEGEAAKRVPGK